MSGYTEEQRSALRVAISKGVTKLRNAQGEEVTYRSLAEMTALLAEMDRQLASRPTPRQHYPTFSKGTR